MTWVFSQLESPWQRKRRHCVFYLSLCFSLPGVIVIIVIIASKRGNDELWWSWQFFKKCEICRRGRTKLRLKTVTKAAECKLITFFLLAIVQSNSPLFFVRNFQWHQTSMRWSRVSKAYHFLKILANCVDSMLFHHFHDSYNFVSKYF